MVFKEPIAVASHQLVLAASVGISIYPDDGDDTEAIIRTAGAAMYLAKKDGGNGWRLYSAEYNACALERLALEEDLRLALERDELELYYQPQVDLSKGVIDGAEALLRWHCPGDGLVSPARSIAAARKKD